jgi:colanic acid/amylovoran biosynthesis glycosyltransferase
VLIYRHQLFKTSEPFIRAQASQLKRFRPVYVGRKTVGRRNPDDEILTIEAASSWDRVANRVWCEPRPFLRVLDKTEPKIIHAHFGLDAVYAMPVAAALGVPLVATLHGFDVTVKKMRMAWAGKPTEMRYSVSALKLGERAEKLICVSEFIKEKALEFGFPENLLIRHYIGIDSAAMTPVVWRGQGPVRILHVARLIEKKGTRYLLEALAKLREQGLSGVKLDVVGDGPLRTKLIAFANSLGLGDSVRFWGAQPWERVMELMSSAYLFCLPSVTARSGDAEGLGMVLLEAGAKGIPVVATNHGGIPEVIKDGVNGLLVQERNPDALAQSIGALVTDIHLRERLAVNARRVVENQFDIAVQTAKLESLYAELCGVAA